MEPFNKRNIEKVDFFLYDEGDEDETFWANSDLS